MGFCTVFFVTIGVVELFAVVFLPVLVSAGWLAHENIFLDRKLDFRSRKCYGLHRLKSDLTCVFWSFKFEICILLCFYHWGNKFVLKNNFIPMVDLFAKQLNNNSFNIKGFRFQGDVISSIGKSQLESICDRRLWLCWPARNTFA